MTKEIRNRGKLRQTPTGNLLCSFQNRFCPIHSRFPITRPILSLHMKRTSCMSDRIYSFQSTSDICRSDIFNDSESEGSIFGIFPVGEVGRKDGKCGSLIGFGLRTNGSSDVPSVFEESFGDMNGDLRERGSKKRMADVKGKVTDEIGYHRVFRQRLLGHSRNR